MTSAINTLSIDGTYPIAGQDNDSQGFRDNFTNIKTNLDHAASEISALQAAVSNPGNVANVAISGLYSDLIGAPTLANVAISGSYTDLTNTPVISTTSQLVTPTNGQTVQFDGSSVSIIHPGATIAALTLIMPANPTNNKTLTVGFIDAVTSISLSAPSASITGSITTAAANSFCKWIYLTALSSWVRIG